MTSPALPPALTNLAKTIITLQNRIAQLERNQRASQLSSTSIEGGTLTVNDPTGNPAVVLGLQSDGSVTAQTVSSYLPPQTPSTPTALAGVLSVWVVWDGQMAGSAAPLLDFQAVQVHCSTMTGFTPSAATLAGTMHGAGLFTVGQLTGGTTYYVALVAINDAGTTGTPSPQATAVAGTVAANITAGTITAELLAAGIVVAGIVDATTITGAQIIADGAAGQYLIYQGAPGTGNLVGSWSSAPGTDPYTNTYGQDLVIGPPSGPQATLARGGAGSQQGAALQFLMNTSDVGTAPQLLSQVVNGGAASQYLQTLLQGPGNTAGTGNQFNVALNSGSDDGTIPATLVLYDGNQVPFLAMENTGTPAMFIGSSPGGTQAFVPVTVNGGFLMYGTAAGQQVVQTFTSAGTQTFTPPAGVTSLDKVEHIGAGAGGQFKSGPGGGSGEYAAATSVAVTPLHAYTWTNGTGGARGISSAQNGGAGGNTTSTWDAITITAHGAPANSGSFTSSGGSGSTAPIHRNGSGGTGYKGATNGGGGGAGAPNGSGPGAAGPANYQTQPGAGASAAAGGLAGWGAWGGWGSTTSNSNTTGGWTGGTGAGGGSGGADPYSSGATGGPGGTGITRITYTLPGVTQLLASMASQTVTDTSGNTAPPGFQGQLVAVQPGTSPSIPEPWHRMTGGYQNSWSDTGSGYNPGRYRLLGSPPNTVEIEGTISHGSVTGTSVMFSLPAGYRPAFSQQAAVWFDTANNSGTIGVNPTTGALSVFQLNATTLIQFRGFISLD